MCYQTLAYLKKKLIIIIYIYRYNIYININIDFINEYILTSAIYIFRIVQNIYGKNPWKI